MRDLREPPYSVATLEAALDRLGFVVQVAQDLDQRAFEQVVRDFASRLPQGALAVFSYSGHAYALDLSAVSDAVEANRAFLEGTSLPSRRNVLLPVDQEPRDLKTWRALASITAKQEDHDARLGLHPQPTFFANKEALSFDDLLVTLGASAAGQIGVFVDSCYPDLYDPAVDPLGGSLASAGWPDHLGVGPLPERTLVILSDPATGSSPCDRRERQGLPSPFAERLAAALAAPGATLQSVAGTLAEPAGGSLSHGSRVFQTPLVPQALDGTVARPEALGLRRYRALLIAVNAQEDPALADLGAPAVEVAALSATLQADYGLDAADIQVLEGPDATRVGVLDALYALTGGALEDEALLVYYSGHGLVWQGQYWWLPYDALAGQSPATWVAAQDVSRALGSARARHALLIANACFGAELVEQVEAPERVTDIYAVAAARSRQVLTAGASEVVPNTGRGVPQSPFSEALVAALERQPPGWVPMSSLAQEVALAVSGQGYPTPLHLTLEGDQGGQLVLVRR